MNLWIVYIVFQIICIIILLPVCKKLMDTRITKLQDLYAKMDSYTHKAKLSNEQIEDELRVSEEYLKKMADKFANDKLDELMRGKISGAMTDEINEQVASVFQENVEAKIKEAIGAQIDRAVRDANLDREVEEFNALHPSICMVRMRAMDLAELQYLLSDVFDQSHTLLAKLRSVCMNVCFVPCKVVDPKWDKLSEAWIPVHIDVEKSQNDDTFKSIEFEHLRFDAENNRWLRSKTRYYPEVHRSFSEGGYHRMIAEMCPSYSISRFIASMLSDNNAYSQILNLHLVQPQKGESCGG